MRFSIPFLVLIGFEFIEFYSIARAYIRWQNQKQTIQFPLLIREKEIKLHPFLDFDFRPMRSTSLKFHQLLHSFYSRLFLSAPPILLQIGQFRCETLVFSFAHCLNLNRIKFSDDKEGEMTICIKVSLFLQFIKLGQLFCCW